jgi:hypothetical protein
MTTKQHTFRHSSTRNAVDKVTDNVRTQKSQRQYWQNNLNCLITSFVSGVVCDLRSSGTLHDVGWWLVNDVSGKTHRFNLKWLLHYWRWNRWADLQRWYPAEELCNISIVMHFLFNLLRIKGLYMFRALLAHLQEVLNKRDLVYCVRVMSVGCDQDCSGTGAANRHNTQAVYQMPFV